jgi:hypothetical protein
MDDIISCTVDCQVSYRDGLKTCRGRSTTEQKQCVDKANGDFKGCWGGCESKFGKHPFFKVSSKFSGTKKPRKSRKVKKV